MEVLSFAFHVVVLIFAFISGAAGKIILPFAVPLTVLELAFVPAAVEIFYFPYLRYDYSPFT